jgi:hypothetical protein
VSKLYRFYYHETEGATKEVSLIKDEDLTLGELRALFYDWLASLGYQVQGNNSE